MAFFSLKNILNSLPFKILGQIGPRAVRERVKGTVLLGKNGGKVVWMPEYGLEINWKLNNNF